MIRKSYERNKIVNTAWILSRLDKFGKAKVRTPEEFENIKMVLKVMNLNFNAVIIDYPNFFTWEITIVK